MSKKFIYNVFIIKNITHSGEAVDKYLVYIVKWMALINLDFLS